MEVALKVDRKNELEFVVKGVDNGFAGLLVSRLLKEDDVEVAQYEMPNPLLGGPIFYVKTKGTPAREVLQKTIRAMKKDLKELV